MNIAFLSSLDPNNVNNWSGTLYFIFQSLRKNHEVEWIGGDILDKTRKKHCIENRNNAPFIPEMYSPLFAGMISDILCRHSKFDIIIARDCLFIAHLRVDIPIVYIGDTTFDLIKDSWGIIRKDIVLLMDEIEKKAILNADHIIYSSQWAKENAVSHYGADASRIEVVEFGANIENIPDSIKNQPSGESCCNLLFIGKDWIGKGGNKTIEVFEILKERNFKCTLTIIGSNPDLKKKYPDLRIIPFIDKSNQEGVKLLHQIMLNAHLFILPTVFDCFGIVFCEASAYGIPSITANVGGVDQVVKNGKNGYLLSADAQAEEYADQIETLFSNKELYHGLRKSSRKEYETRLNWDVWSQKVNAILGQAEKTSKKHNKNSYLNDFYLPVYVVNLKERIDRLFHTKQQFNGRQEFNINIIETVKHPKGTVGLWESLVKVVKKAMEREDEVIVFCEDDHYFTDYYNKDFFLHNVVDAWKRGAELLPGGICGFGTAVPLSPHLYWIDWYWGNQFIVIFNSLYQRIIDYQFKENDMADLVLSGLTDKKMVIFPFISIQKEFGYSDINKSNETPGYLNDMFFEATKRLSLIHTINNYYNYGNNTGR